MCEFFYRTSSSLKRSLKGVNFVALDSEVLCDQMTEMSSSAHFPFGLPCNLFEMPWRIMLFALLTRLLDYGCLTEAKHTFIPICISLNILLSKLGSVVHCELSWHSEAAYDLLLEEFFDSLRGYCG